MIDGSSVLSLRVFEFLSSHGVHRVALVDSVRVVGVTETIHDVRISYVCTDGGFPTFGAAGIHFFAFALWKGLCCIESGMEEAVSEWNHEILEESNPDNQDDNTECETSTDAPNLTIFEDDETQDSVA
jgi:hypothetical protein